MVQLSHLDMTTGKTIALTLRAFVDKVMSLLCAVLCLVTQSCPTLCKPVDCTPPGSSVLGGSSGKNTVVGCHALLQGIFPTQRIEPRSPSFQANSLPSEPPGKPKNSGVGSISLPQENLPTQKLNRGLLNCRWILY